MEQSSKNQDCYFYYYSTCTKGDSCHFRHEPSALGCEVMCTYWQQGNCMNEHCNFRHMELKKNRKSIPCYWESQRGGCKKPHCPFLHTLDRPAPSESTINPSKTSGPKPVPQEWSNRPVDGGKFPEPSGEGSVGHGSNESSSFISGSVVDPIIVNFNEETDNEGYTSSPQKSTRPSSPRSSLKYQKKKTYEEERIDEIVEETAAYYSYPMYDDQNYFYSTEEYSPPFIQTLDKEQKNNMDFEVLTLDEIKRRKREQVSDSGPTVDNVDSDATQDNIVTDSESTVDKVDSVLPTGSPDKLPAESRKRKMKSEDVKPIKLRRSGSIKRSQDNVDKVETEDDDEDKDIEMRLCDSTSDKKENGKGEDDLSLDNFVDDAGDSVEGFDDIVDDIDQLLQDKTS